MSQSDRIENYLLRADITYDAIDDETWILHDDNSEVDNIVIQSSGNLVIFSVRLMDLPTDSGACGKLYEKLLRFNGTEMLSGAYGISDAGVVIIETLRGENLDYNEFAAAVDGLTMAITEHYPQLKEFHSLSSQED